MLNVDINSVSIIDDGIKRVVLQNINFSVEKGKIYTILGKNGSGKSTLIKTLSYLLPTAQYEIEGKVFFHKIDLLHSTLDNLQEIRKNKIRYVFQDVANSLDPLKKLKYYFNLSEAKPETIENLLNYFLLPSYKKLSGLHSYELSGGIAQRLLIVLALLANPELLILDEPTSGVDYAVMNLTLLKLQEFIKGKSNSVLIVTQDINFALKSSDYIAYLSDGKLTGFLSPDEFLQLKIEDEIKNFIQSYKEINNASS